MGSLTVIESLTDNMIHDESFYCVPPHEIMFFVYAVTFAFNITQIFQNPWHFEHGTTVIQITS